MTPKERAAMQQALEALEELHYSSGTVVAAKKYESATAALREALAEQAEQEPVVCHHCQGLGRIYMGQGDWIRCAACNTTGKLYAALVAAHEREKHNSPSWETVDDAIAAEREACAKVADGELMNTNMLTSYPPKSSAAWNIAAAIRARSEK